MRPWVASGARRWGVASWRVVVVVIVVVVVVAVAVVVAVPPPPSHFVVAVVVIVSFAVLSLSPWPSPLAATVAHRP